MLRVAPAGAFPFVPVGGRVAVLGAALPTEYLDGALARRFGWTSRFGRLLDPIADRCLFGAVALTLMLDGAFTALELAALGAGLPAPLLAATLATGVLAAAQYFADFRRLAGADR